MTAYKPAKRLFLGAAYYPEHWPESRWSEDIQMMNQAGFNVVRMGEFAWSTLEPQPGLFVFDWLERAIDLLAKSGIKTVLGTPTAAPPAWLTYQFPETLAMDEFGRRAQHGNRCHYCVTSEAYQRAVRLIVTALAVRFGANPNVIGWQIDNEYNRVCYCDHCQAEFQKFLQGRYATLEALNERWSTRYWSQTYSAWEQIPFPIGFHNPGLLLDQKRFTTLCYEKFQQLQIECLKPYLPDDAWITHNFMGWFQGYDHYQISRDLDLASWDWYISTGQHDYIRSGAIHDLVRGYKKQNYWVIETQPGHVNWNKINSDLHKGEARAMAWHAIGHGADAILYWQWRSALGGQEQYHGSLMDASGNPRPFFAEVEQLGNEFNQIQELFAESSPVQSRVALLNDYSSLWSIKWQSHHQDFDYERHLIHYYRPYALKNIPVDIISADSPLTGYRLIIAPALHVLSPERANNLLAFVKRGGHLVLTARCAMKDEYNALFSSRQPGLLADAAGVEVEEYYALQEPVPLQANWFSGSSSIWAERLIPLPGKSPAVIGRYGRSNGWLDGQLAITVNAYGSGMVYYCGAYLDDQAQEAFLGKVAHTANIKPLLITPPGVEVRQRVNPNGVQIGIVVNHTDQHQLLKLPWPAHDHLTGQDLELESGLGPYEVRVITRSVE